MRVLDFTRILSGPYATMLLADLGAEVIKLERPGTGDDTRSWGPPFAERDEHLLRRRQPRQEKRRDRPAERARPSARGRARGERRHPDRELPSRRQRRLGLAYDQLEPLNSGLVYASINGFGSHGPRAQDAGTEVIVEAQTGLMAMMGTPDGPPVRFGVAMVDIATGIALVCGVLAALLERDRSGLGRELEFPLYTTAFSCLATVIASASVDGASQEGRWGSGHPSIVPYAAFEARDGFVVLGAINELMWERLCAALGLAELAGDERAASNERRVGNRGLVDATIAAAVSSRTTAEVTEELNRAGVLVAPVRNAAAAVEDPQVAALELVDELDGIRFTRTPLSQFARRPLAPAQRLGADSAAVLTRPWARAPTRSASCSKRG